MIPVQDFTMRVPTPPSRGVRTVAVRGLMTSAWAGGTRPSKSTGLHDFSIFSASRRARDRETADPVGAVFRARSWACALRLTRARAVALLQP